MAVNRLTFSNDLKAKDLCYSDEFFKLRSEKVIPSDSFSFSNYEAFKNLIDFKTNNYSNLFLIDKQQNSNWLESNERDNDEQISLATTLSWFAENLEDELEQGSWLYFLKNYNMFDTGVDYIDCHLTYGRPEKNYSNYIFYVNFINENECTISHTYGDVTYYLVVENTKTVRFSSQPINDNEKFVFILDDNKLRLFKKILHNKYDERDEIIGTYFKFYTLFVHRPNEGEAVLMVVEGSEEEKDNNICFVTNNILDFNFFVDTSWISYDRSKFISSINDRKSAYNLETQALIHHQYNKEDGFNFIPLKNNLSYKGNTIRGNYMNQSDSRYPDVDFRTYTGIHTGLNQEKGNDTITLTFNFTDQEYELNDGDDLIITIEDTSLEGTNMMESLWPYKYININDTKFIKNGAFGSNVPFFADKFKKLQNYKSNLKDDTNKSVSANNETYLCSWLYKPDNETSPIWLDRYYYPDLISRKDALHGNSTYEQSFENILDKNYTNHEYYKDVISGKIHRNTYFDKKSDLVIEAGNTYRYQRLSKEMVNEVLEQIEEHSIPTLLDNAGREFNINELFQFNNENYRILKYDKWNKTNAINFNTDIYLSRKKRIGLQIFGTDYTDGFNIQNRKDITPYHYYASDKVLYLCNNKFEIVHQFDLWDKYEDTILKLFLGDVFDDVIIVSGIWMYILSYDLRLKSRIDMTATTGKDNAIKDLDKNLSQGLKPILEGSGYYDEDNNVIIDDDKFGTYTNGMPSISLINYPYNHNKIEIENKVDISGSVNLNHTDKNYSITMNRKLIGLRKITINENITNKGSIKISSNLCKTLCKYNSILYKNNIYIPINQGIMKIIMCPDSDIDFEIFNDDVREEYPAVARFLTSDEFYLNYTKSNDSDSDSEDINLEQGFISVENKVKNIFISEDGKIYGLNYDQFGMTKDGDTIYGLYDLDKFVAQGQWWWIFNQSLSKMEADTATSKYAEFSSPNSIDRIKFNELGEMCLIRNFNNLAENENDDNNKRMDIYDITKQKVYTYDLSSYDEVISLDAYNYIDESMKEQTCFTALCKSYGKIYRVSYLSKEKKMLVKALELPIDTAENFVETVNSNALLRYKEYNALYFNLHVPSHYTYDFLATIKWSLDDIQDGWYNINVYIDLDAAIFQIRINDVIYDTINEETHSWFKPYVSSDGTTFNSTYYLGCLGKKYGTTLNKILKNGVYDPYVCKNSKVENLSIYNKKLDYYQYQAMRLRDKKINKIILTLPCGNRNSIDEMVRFFKYNASPAISNKVKINITGTGLQTEGEFDLLRKEIMAVLENNKDCLVDVKEIEFV